MLAYYGAEAHRHRFVSRSDGVVHAELERCLREGEHYGTIIDLAESLGLNRATVMDALHRMKGRGQVLHVARGLYLPVPKEQWPDG